MVDGDRPVTGHEAKQLRLLGPLPAADAGAYRLGHQNRLTRAGAARFTPRLPSQDVSRALTDRESATFAVSRPHTSADGTATNHVCHLKTAHE